MAEQVESGTSSEPLESSEVLSKESFSSAPEEAGVAI